MLEFNNINKLDEYLDHYATRHCLGLGNNNIFFTMMDRNVEFPFFIMFEGKHLLKNALRLITLAEEYHLEIVGMEYISNDFFSSYIEKPRTEITKKENDYLKYILVNIDPKSENLRYDIIVELIKQGEPNNGILNDGLFDKIHWMNILQLEELIS